MININDTLLESLNEKELWLLLHLVKRINKDNVCWPSNKTILKDTRWKDERTLAAVKKALIEKGILIQSTRHRTDGSQTANEYTITTDLISVFVTAAKVQQYAANNAGTPLHKMHPPTYTERRGQGVQKTHPHEVLTNEVLTIEGESAPAQFHVQVHSLETIQQESIDTAGAAFDWMQVAKEMEAYAKGDGAAQWRFMCEAQGYKGEVLPIVSNWASKASKYQLMNWKSEFRKLQTWLKTESRADYKAAQRPAYGQQTAAPVVAPAMRLTNPKDAPR